MTLAPRILATAGHIDHGKSTLVEALTGTNPDRLPEKKARHDHRIEIRAPQSAPAQGDDVR